MTHRSVDLRAPIQPLPQAERERFAAILTRAGVLR